MSKSSRNSNKKWTGQDIQKLASFAAHNKPTGLIAWELGRTKDSVYNKASQENISLHPTNKSPYNRRKR